MVLRHATNLGYVIWSNAKKRMFSVTEEGHEHVRNYIKKKIAQRKTNGGAAGEAGSGIGTPNNNSPSVY